MSTTRKFLLYVVLGLISASPALAVRDSQNSAFLEALQQYFELLTSGNMEIARDMWTPEVLERSQRFGIVYENIPLKVDCSSPIIRNLDRVKNGLVAPLSNYENKGNGQWYRVQIARLIGGIMLDYHYWLERRGDWYWLTFPQDYYCRDWKIKESRYLRVHADPRVSRYLNKLEFEEADRIIEALADTLGISKDMMKQIADRKIEYFYCSTDSVVEEITGNRTRGMVDLGPNDIISANFPHFHELVHLLVNIRLHKLPLYTLPLLREGTAVRYGGRWGKSHAALMDLGSFLLKEKLVVLDSVLTQQGFEAETSADIVYPAAGLFCGYLIDRLGLEDYFRLYLKLSGTSDVVRGFDTEDVQDIIAGSTGLRWEDIERDFDEYMVRRAREASAVVPGELSKGKTSLDAGNLQITEDKDWLSLTCAPAADGNPPQGFLLFSRSDDLEKGASSLFDEQFADSLGFKGYRYAIMFDQNEAGLYDYATNQLLAKYIYGLSPSGDYLDDETGRVAFRFRKSLTQGHVPKEGDYELLTN